MDNSDLEKFGSKLVNTEQFEVILKNLETFKNGTALVGQMRNLTDEPMIDTYLQIFLSDVGGNFGETIERVVSLEAAGHIFEELVVLYDELNDIPTCYLTPHDVNMEIAEFDDTLLGSLKNKFLDGQPVENENEIDQIY